LPMPCQPRLYSGDHPCTCVSDEPARVGAGRVAA
jgi:hypothetical protein